MNITISEDMLKKYGFTFGEVLYGLMLINGIDYAEVEKQLLSLRKIVERNGNILMTHGFKERLENFLTDSDKHKEKPERVSALVDRLQEVFPEGKKDGGVYYWRGNRTEISGKLRMFFKLYGKDTFKDDEIVDAAKRYVESFNGQYKFMYLLKYFILKNKREEGGVEQVSELLTYLENKDQTASSKDWTSEIR